MEDEDLIQQPDAATPPKQLSNDDMLGLALVALAPGLAGALLGGKRGAFAGGAAGAGAAGAALKDQNDREAKAEDAALARKQGLADFEDKEKIKNRLNPKDPKKASFQEYVDDTGATRQAPMAADGSWTKSPTDQVIKPGPKPGDKPSRLQKTDLTDKDGNPLAWDSVKGEYVLATAPAGGIKKPAAEQRQIENLGKDMAGSSDLFAAIGAVETQIGSPLEQFDPKTGLVDGKKIDLPGVSLPGLGRVGAYSGDARALQSRIARVFNVELKDRSGATVTDSELERLKTEFGAGKFNTESEMLGALQQYKSAAVNALRNAEAKYPSDVVRTYQERGGFTSDKVSPEKPPISADQKAALEWLNDPANAKDPLRQAVIEKLAREGVLNVNKTAGE